MNYNLLLDGICEMGYRLLGCGAETYRVEDTVCRLAAAYGTQAQVFVIPNCLIVSITDQDGKQITSIRRSPFSSMDLTSLEEYNALSRRLCADPPEDTGEILRQVKQVAGRIRPYSAPIQLLGFFLGASFFAMFYSGGLLEALIGGIAGVFGSGCSILLSRARTNFFINTMVSGFVLAIVGYGLYILGVPVNIEPTIVGAILVLVPGLVFTNFMSDLMLGDIMAGLSTFARAVLTAGAIALGTGTAIALFQRFVDVSHAIVPPIVHSPVLSCAVAFVACLGFCLPFNVRGVGMLLCCLGGTIGWAAYLVAEGFGGSVFVSSFIGSIAVAIYSNGMSRIRKCPVTPYLVISYFPLVPGFTIYQALSYGIRGDIPLFLETFIRTFGIAGCIALGTLMVTSAMHIYRQRKERHHGAL